MYDPQIGRFGQVDPLGDATSYYSPYSFGSNNPISHVDPFGLTDTVVTTKTTNLTPYTVYGHKKQVWGGFYWPESTRVERATWTRNQGLYADRLQNNQPLSQVGDPVSYTSSLSMYKRWTQADNEGRAMQAWALGIMAAPALAAAAPAEVGLALRIKAGINLGAFAVDAGMQTVVNTMEHKNIFTNYNFLSGGAALLIGALEGASLSNIVGVNAVTSTLGSSVNLSINTFSGKDRVLSFNPLSIIIGTVFGSAAGKVSQINGGGATMDALASPFNFTGTAIDEATKPKDQ